MDRGTQAHNVLVVPLPDTSRRPGPLHGALFSLHGLALSRLSAHKTQIQAPWPRTGDAPRLEGDAR